MTTLNKLRKHETVGWKDGTGAVYRNTRRKLREALDAALAALEETDEQPD